MLYRCAYALLNLTPVKVPCRSWEQALDYAEEASSKGGPAAEQVAFAQEYALRDGNKYFIKREVRYLGGRPDDGPV